MFKTHASRQQGKSAICKGRTSLENELMRIPIQAGIGAAGGRRRCESLLFRLFCQSGMLVCAFFSENNGSGTPKAYLKYGMQACDQISDVGGFTWIDQGPPHVYRWLAGRAKKKNIKVLAWQ